MRASSSDGSASTALYTIAVIDINDTAPASTPPPCSCRVQPPGRPVGLLTAIDPDSLGTLQNWTITGGSGAAVFAIDPATGLITVADPAALDILLNPAFDIDVTVSDGLNTSAPRSIIITVTNVEEPPVLAPLAVSVPENSPPAPSSPP
ncbi:MAG: cadherin repeat domain-containing protein [Burkholderiaceae bacterium]